MFITLLGRPGAGKTTLGRAVQRATSIPYIGGGTLFRQWVSERRPGWEKIEQSLAARIDAPPDQQLLVLRDAVKASPDGAILDGFPKTANLRDRVEETLGQRIAVAIYLDAPAELAQLRVSHRLACRTCGLPTDDLTATIRAPCTEEGCGGELWRRPEDEGIDHAREGTDSLVLRSAFATDGRLLTLAAATTVTQRVAAVVEEMQRRSG